MRLGTAGVALARPSGGGRPGTVPARDRRASGRVRPSRLVLPKPPLLRRSAEAFSARFAGAVGLELTAAHIARGIALRYGRGVTAAFFAALAMASSGSLALAQSDWSSCSSGEPARIIQGCSAILSPGNKIPAAQRALAYVNR